MRSKLSSGKKHFEIYSLIPVFSIGLSSVFVFSPFTFGLHYHQLSAECGWCSLTYLKQKKREFIKDVQTPQKNYLVKNLLFLIIYTLVNKIISLALRTPPGCSLSETYLFPFILLHSCSSPQRKLRTYIDNMQVGSWKSPDQFRLHSPPAERKWRSLQIECLWQECFPSPCLDAAD